MATYNKFNVASLNLIQGVHQFGTHSFKSYLSNAAPVATNTIKANIAEISAAGPNGYTSGGDAVALVAEAVSGTTARARPTGDITVTALAGQSIGAFQYVVFYNDTPTSPTDPLWSWWDYGSAVTLAATETFTEDYDNTNGIYSIG